MAKKRKTAIPEHRKLKEGYHSYKDARTGTRHPIKKKGKK